MLPDLDTQKDADSHSKLTNYVSQERNSLTRSGSRMVQNYENFTNQNTFDAVHKTKLLQRHGSTLGNYYSSLYR